MKTAIKLIILSLGIIYSCDKEIIQPINESEKIDSATSDSLTVDYQFKAPYASIALTACGDGFKATITKMGQPDNDSYPYEIREAGSCNVVDSGMISDGQNTNWVLSPCTDYDFEFWGYSGCSTCSSVQTVCSDGCGGIYIC